MRTHKVITCVRVPGDLILTLRVLLRAARKLSTCEIHDAVDFFIDELNTRYGDPDLEPEPDETDEEDENA